MSLLSLLKWGRCLKHSEKEVFESTFSFSSSREASRLQSIARTAPIRSRATTGYAKSSTAYYRASRIHLRDSDRKGKEKLTWISPSEYEYGI